MTAWNNSGWFPYKELKPLGKPDWKQVHTAALRRSGEQLSSAIQGLGRLFLSSRPDGLDMLASSGLQVASAAPGSRHSAHLQRQRRGNPADPHLNTIIQGSLTGKVPDGVKGVKNVGFYYQGASSGSSGFVLRKLCAQWGKPEPEDRKVGHIQQEKRETGGFGV